MTHPPKKKTFFKDKKFMKGKKETEEKPLTFTDKKEKEKYLNSLRACLESFTRIR
jgi:hypothetical protein